jgi:hypothetical protein
VFGNATQATSYITNGRAGVSLGVSRPSVERKGMEDSERVEVNRGEHAYSVQVGMDSDLMEWAMTNAEAIAEQQCQSSLLCCQIDELVEEDSVVGLRLDARNADGSTFIAHWESGSTQFQVYRAPDTSELYSDLLPPETPEEEL